ncbi:uncharacterized protein LOC135118788 [Helicoverpa armigera]|uniref:uncharacterized protein LOC135118788 n=1 Tax=Helicoverpa armigera TaxID=29058 RepID=UPI003082B593
MPRMMRSPPQSSPGNCALLETQSEPDLSPVVVASESSSHDLGNITTRPSNKRFRGDDSWTEPDKFIDLKNMLLSWKSDQDIILNKLVAEVSELKQQGLSIQKTNTEIEKTIQFFNKSYEDMRERVERLEKEHKECEKRINDMINISSGPTITKLEAKIDSMEQQARLCNVEVCNLPEKRNENLFTIIEAIGNAVKFPVSQNDIVAIHRVPHAHQNDNKPKNIIVKFKSLLTRDNLLSAYRKSKCIKTDQIGISGALTSIYLNEHLTLKNKALFREARKLANECGFKYVWVRNATILVRKQDGTSAFAIRSNVDLGKIVSGKKTPTDTDAKEL